MPAKFEHVDDFCPRDRPTFNTQKLPNPAPRCEMMRHLRHVLFTLGGHHNHKLILAAALGRCLKLRLEAGLAEGEGAPRRAPRSPLRHWSVEQPFQPGVSQVVVGPLVPGCHPDSHAANRSCTGEWKNCRAIPRRLSTRSEWDRSRRQPWSEMRFARCRRRRGFHCASQQPPRTGKARSRVARSHSAALMAASNALSSRSRATGAGSKRRVVAS